jgi:hypothetical protein
LRFSTADIVSFSLVEDAGLTSTGRVAILLPMNWL